MNVCLRNLALQHLPWYSFTIRNQRVKQKYVNKSTKTHIFFNVWKLSFLSEGLSSSGNWHKLYCDSPRDLLISANPPKSSHLRSSSTFSRVIWASGIFSLKSCFQTSDPWILYSPWKCLFCTLRPSLARLLEDSYTATVITIPLRVESKTARLVWCKAVFVYEL